jgi:hypothetical protein
VGEEGRNTNYKSSLGTYWKLYRLVYEKAIGEMINIQMNRVMHRIFALY